MEIGKQINDLTYKVIGVCMNVLQEMGPGFPEEYYQKALEHEFEIQRVGFEPQKAVQMLYKDVQVGLNYLDFAIEDRIILEIKSVNKLTDVHRFQVMKYFACSKYEIGLPVNFGQTKLEFERLLPPQKIQNHRSESR